MPQAEGGEDVDLRHPADWRTVLKLVGVLLFTIADDQLARLGRSAARCCSSDRRGPSGSRTLVRDVIVGFVLSVASWYVFHEGLGVPPGRDPGRGALMENLGLLMDGFSTALTPENLLYAVIGVLLGTFVGVLPGIGPAMAVALLLPVTYGLEPISAFIMFAGIYYGGMYGGSTTSILLNTPGESASVMTALEGNLMARAGRAAQALATAAIGSFIAGTIGTLLVVFFAPALAIGGGRDRRPVLLRAHGAGDGHGHQRARRIARCAASSRSSSASPSAWSASTSTPASRG